MRNIFILAAAGLFFSCSQKKESNPVVQIISPYGDVQIELYPAKAPKTVAAFISYIDSGYYKGSSFYRVIKAEDMPTDYNDGLIQGGIWPLMKNIKGIDHEPTSQTGLSHTNGIVSLARTGPGTATTEFFICIGDQAQLDAGRKGTGDGLGYAAFGKVIKGMDVVRKIQSESSTGENFRNKIPINNITRY